MKGVKGLAGLEEHVIGFKASYYTTKDFGDESLICMEWGGKYVQPKMLHTKKLDRSPGELGDLAEGLGEFRVGNPLSHGGALVSLHSPRVTLGSEA